MINRKTKAIAFIGTFILTLGLIFQGIRVMNSWYDDHYFQFNQILTTTWKAPVEIKQREKQVTVTEVINVIEEAPKLEDLTDIESYICEKWGPFDCRVALSVAKAESGMREGAFNVNTNGSVDIGIFQINSIHWDVTNREGCSLKEIVDQYKNVDCAFRIWDGADGNLGDGKGNFGAWVAFNSGSFKAHLQ